MLRGVLCMDISSKRSLEAEKHFLSELKEMLNESQEPKEKVFAVFCERHGVSLDECRSLYYELAAKGEVKAKV